MTAVFISAKAVLCEDTRSKRDTQQAYSSIEAWALDDVQSSFHVFISYHVAPGKEFAKASENGCLLHPKNTASLHHLQQLAHFCYSGYHLSYASAL